MEWKVFVGLLVLGLALTACGGDRATDDGKVRVYAGIPPVAYLAERIGGEHVQVDVLVSGNQDPHTFDPSPRQAVELERAHVYLSVGLPFEREVVKTVRSNNPDMVVLNLARAEAESHEEDPHEHGDHERGEHEAHEHAAHDAEHEEHEGHEEHGHHAGHDHKGPDPHVWLSPKRLRAMAHELAGTLADQDPAHSADYEHNRDAFLEELNQVDERIHRQLEPFSGRRFYVYHPAFGHFGEAYGLEQQAVESGGKAPTMRQVDELVQRAREDGVRVIFVQPQFSPRAAQTAAEALDGAVVPIDPLRRNVLESLREIADRLEDAFQETRPQESP